MTDSLSPKLLMGAGIYTLPEASRLTRIPVAKLRRWLRGYSRGQDQRQRPVFERDFPDLGEGGAAISFLDLIEALFIDAFHRHGVPWKHIRESAVEAATLFGTNHPFAVRRFETDGRRIFATVFKKDESGDPRMIDLVSRQAVFQDVFAPLMKQLEYDVETDAVARWWPLGRRVPVVVDPDRSRGMPVALRSGVPTYVLARAVAAEGGDVDRVARWYEVPLREVVAAVEFEKPVAA